MSDRVVRLLSLWPAEMQSLMKRTLLRTKEKLRQPTEDDKGVRMETTGVARDFACPLELSKVLTAGHRGKPSRTTSNADTEFPRARAALPTSKVVKQRGLAIQAVTALCGWALGSERLLEGQAEIYVA